VGSIILARALGPEGYGQYAFIIALLTTLSIPLGPALMQLTTREAARLHHDGKADQIYTLLRWANRNIWVGSALVAAVIGGLALWQAEWRVDDRWTLLMLGLVALPLLGLNAVRSGILAGLRRVVMGQFPNLLVRPLVLLAVVGVLLLFGSLNPATAVAAFITGAGVAFILGIILLRRVFPHEQQTPRKLSHTNEQNSKLRRAWMPFTLLVAASTLNAQIGILLLGWLSTDEQVAAMQVAERGAMLVNLSLALVNVVISPHITRIFLQKEPDALQKLSRQSARLAVLFALPIVFLLLFYGDFFVSIFFGSLYVDMVSWPLRILVIAQLINVAFGSLGMFLSMSRYEKDTLQGNTLALIINGVLGLFLIPHYGALGASLSVAVGLVVWNLFLGFKVYLRLGVRPGVI
jgi:O-antigen/teichoic acid export membrane protein